MTEWKPTKPGVYLCSHPREPYRRVVVDGGLADSVSESGARLLVKELSGWSLPAPDKQDGPPTPEQLARWPWWAVWWGGDSDGPVLTISRWMPTQAETMVSIGKAFAPVQPDWSDGPRWVPRAEVCPSLTRSELEALDRAGTKAREALRRDVARQNGLVSEPDHYRSTPPDWRDVMAWHGEDEAGNRRGWQLDDGKPEEWIELRMIDAAIRGWHHGPGDHFYSPEGWGERGEWGWPYDRYSPSYGQRLRPVLVSPSGTVTPVPWPTTTPSPT